MLNEMSGLLAAAPLEPQARRVTKEDGEQALDVLRVWPEPTCLRHTEALGWREHWPTVDLCWADTPPDDDGFPVEDLMGWDVPLEPLFERVPDRVRDALIPQDHRVCWAALRLFHAVPSALDLARSIPSLAGLLALKMADGDDPRAFSDLLRDRLRGPRRHLLPLVGLDADRSALRILRRVDPSALGFPGQEEVVAALWDDDRTVRKWLRHLPRIDADAVSVLRDPRLRPLCTFRLLADRDDVPTRSLREHLLRVIRARNDGEAPRTPARFYSRSEVFAYCQELESAPRWAPAEFPAPFEHPTDDVVLAGDPEILLEPVHTATTMHERAIADGLCIARERQYPERARAGDGALYVARWANREHRIEATVWLRPSRVTLGWSVEEAALSQNQPVPDGIIDRLAAWADAITSGHVEAATTAPVPPEAPPPVQLCLPLRLRHSPLDTPSSFGTGLAERPGGPGLDSWWFAQ